MRAMVGEKEFYMLYFQEPGKAEAELEADVRTGMRMLLYSGSGDAPPKDRWRAIFERSETLLDTCVMPDELPAWLGEKDIDFFTVASDDAASGQIGEGVMSRRTA